MRGLSLLVPLLVLAALGCGADEDVACREDGGIWECKDTARSECRCAKKTGDGGRACTDSGMCEGACIHTTGGCGLEPDSPDRAQGTCQSFATRFTCFEELLRETQPSPVQGDPDIVVVNCHSTC